ncbi:hypothetical protein B0H16DRAFT_1558760 [Mycena metata]|uniref:Uncharacterized protein n=1 Tax=Mycena metata TaxID=1033252 RepID=A0AAD7HTR0_9AGAR|nr:hypothetical protein B0H16DRAFT_1589554 [Mycena metata]KAJ7745082.1 hypothetical protein B0H16DRAFT_1558760 [Mycena metata]
MQRYLILLLCLGLVQATLQNYTVDDTSPDIQYGGEKLQCDATSCPPEFAKGAFNSSATLTTGSITFSFTGTGIYASLDLLGVCSVTLDGSVIANFTLGVTEALLGLRANISESNLANQPHTLVIQPAANLTTLIGFDQLVYTASLPAKKSHVGAIVGGVIGGIVLTIGALFLALFARRRKLIIRRNQRKTAVLRGISAARHDQKVGEEDATELPT